MQVFVVNTNDEDYIFINVNDYALPPPPDVAAGVIYPPNTDILNDGETGCNNYRIQVFEGEYWGYTRDEEGHWLRDSKMEARRRSEEE